MKCPMTSVEEKPLLKHLAVLEQRARTDAAFAAKILASLEQRILTEQPKESPLQQYERLMKEHGKIRR